MAENKIKYGCFNSQLKIMTVFIALLALIGGIYNVGAIVDRKMSPNVTFYLVLSNALWSWSAALAIIGVCFDFYHILLPFLVMLVFGLSTILTGFAITVYDLAAFSDASELNSELALDRNELIPLACGLLFAVPIIISFIYIVNKCYLYLKQSKRDEEDSLVTAV